MPAEPWECGIVPAITQKRGNGPTAPPAGLSSNVRSAMCDLRAEHVEALAHEGGKAGPAFRRNHVAVDISLGRLDVDIDAADCRDFRLACAKAGNLAAFQYAGYGH